MWWVWGYLWVLCSLHSVNCLRIQVLENDSVGYDFSDSNAVFQDRSYLLPNSQVNAIRGPFMYPNPRNACTTVPPPPNHTFIAFVEDYLSCPEMAESNVKNAGFAALLAYSEYRNAYLSTKTPIPQALITDSAFAGYIKKIILSSNMSDPELVIWDDSFTKLEKLFIIFGAILLVAVVLSICVFCASLCCRVALVKWRTRGLSHWQVRALPKRKYRKKKETTETCSICLDEFKEGDTIRVLPCGHVFHPKCVDEWLQKWNRTCPLCKSTIKRKGGRAHHPPAQTDENETSLLLPQDERQSLLTNEVVGRNRTGSTDYGGTNELAPPSRSDSARSNPDNTGQDSHLVRAEIEFSVESGRDALHSSNSIYHTPHQSDEEEDCTPSYATAYDSHEIGV